MNLQEPQAAEPQAPGDRGPPLLTEDDLRRMGGLSEEEAAARLQTEGFNELPGRRTQGTAALVVEVVGQPMNGLLVACGALYLALGDLQEALILLISVFVIIGISLYQKRKTERALEALRDLSSPRALVIRDGRERRVAGREVARGDLVVLAEGDRVPADGIVLWAVNLAVDESLLTGESVPVRKVEGAESAAMDRPGGEDLPCVYSGTLVVRGQGIARVKATGPHTELGRIGKALETTVPEATHLERETGRIVRVMAVVGLSLCAVVAAVYALQHQDWLQGTLAGLALAMSMLPEEFPVILTIFLALGAWRISQRRVLTRRMAAIEALGSATVLCVDKTGTLTENRMAVSVLAVDGQRCDLRVHRDELPEDFHALVEFAVLASQRNPFDPMEQAINALGRRYLVGTEHLHDSWTLLREYPLTRGLLAMSHVWQSRDDAVRVIGAKGAPEAVADLCHLDAARVRILEDDIAVLAEQGLRVLGVARAVFAPGPLPLEQHDFDFEFLGLVALSDPLRADVPAAMAECYRAGIRTVMITGDYPVTARNIAAQIGLAPRTEVVSGPELDAMDDAELSRRVRTTNIFARVVPEQKLRLVNALKANGEVVAMTGDGVNDAPALKAAHIGIAMGGRGTDVAREAAALVLLNDDFASIVQAVRLGRRVFDNMRKAMAYVLAIHVPIAGLSLVPVLLGWPLLLLPVHIVFLEMIIDPACSIVFEAEQAEANVMDRPPRNPREPLFGRVALWTSALQGVLAFLLAFGVLAVAMHGGYGEGRARTLAFSILVLGNLGLIFANRSRSASSLRMLRVPNRALVWVAGGALAVLCLSVALAPARSIFHFAAPSPSDVAWILAAGALGLTGFDTIKLVLSERRLDARGASD